MKKLLLLILFLAVLNGNAQEVKNSQAKDGAFLEAKIAFIPTQPVRGQEIIQPGSAIIISAELKNTGNRSNEQGYFFVRFAYPNPLASQAKSQLFVTEKVMLPPIGPGKIATIEFATTQVTPSLYDYIRQDFGMRQYQAVVVIDSKEYIIGNASLTFSAYYYAGPNHEITLEVPSGQNQQQSQQQPQQQPTGPVPVEPMQPGA